MNALENIGKIPDIFKDPFQLDSVKNMSIFYFPRSKWSGQIKFKNGNTSGEQEFEGDTLESVAYQMKMFLETIRS